MVRGGLSERRKKLLILVASALVVLVAGSIFAWECGVDRISFHVWMEKFHDFIHALAKRNPIFLLLAIGILPSFFVPSSILCILSGVIYGKTVGFIVSFLGLGINLVVTYGLAAFVVKKFVHKIVNYAGYNVPEVPSKDHISFITLIRVIPGIPLAIQSYILGLANVKFKPYFIISWIAEIFWVVGFVLMGGGIGKGHLTLAITGFLALLLLAFATKIFYKKYGKSRNKYVVSRKQ
ncbi:MAG: hypothetical protein A2007_05815 [Verrucomicrobia bacterium GWC2_42_7]|nr:MAG: hypothetical protein A2007_05815 [Verrucomicrobia bacterium GWC2_42_7]